MQLTIWAKQIQRIAQRLYGFIYLRATLLSSDVLATLVANLMYDRFRQMASSGLWRADVIALLERIDSFGPIPVRPARQTCRGCLSSCPSCSAGERFE